LFVFLAFILATACLKSQAVMWKMWSLKYADLRKQSVAYAVNGFAALTVSVKKIKRDETSSVVAKLSCF